MDSLQTARLSIERLTEDDATFILELVNDPDWLRFIGDKNVHSLEDARQYLRNGPLAMYDRLGFGLYRVSRRTDRLPLGMCGLLKRDGLDDVDIGFAFLPAARGHGYAFEAAEAVLAHGLGPLGLQRIVAITDVDNVPSSRLLERLGMKFVRNMQLSAGDAVLKLYAIEADARR